MECGDRLSFIHSVPSDWPTLHVPSKDGASSSGSSDYISYAEKFGFGDLELELPDLDGLAEQLQPVAPPPWLKAALKFKSKSAELLAGQPIMYKFPEDEGGWAIGVVNAALEDEEDTVEVLVGDKDNEITGVMPKNFQITFADDVIDALIEYDDYASAGVCDDGGWCLMAPEVSAGKRGGGGGKGKAAAKAPASGKGKAPAELSKEEKRAEKERLLAEAAAIELSSSDDE